MLAGCHRPCATPPSTPLTHDDDKGDKAEAAEASTTSSLRATKISTFMTNEDAPLALPIHPC